MAMAAAPRTRLRTDRLDGCPAARPRAIVENGINMNCPFPHQWPVFCGPLHSGDRQICSRWSNASSAAAVQALVRPQRAVGERHRGIASDCLIRAAAGITTDSSDSWSFETDTQPKGYELEQAELKPSPHNQVGFN